MVNDNNGDSFALETRYVWVLCEPIEQPSPEIVAGIADRPDRNVFRFFRADIRGMKHYADWPTRSWLEVAITKTGDCRVLWKSGIDDCPELPARILSDWGKASNQEAALDQFVARMVASGFPLIGVCDVEQARTFGGHFRQKPIVLGFDLTTGKPT